MLLALADLVGLAAIGDDDAPPAVVAVLGGVLGLITLVRAGAVCAASAAAWSPSLSRACSPRSRRPSVLDRGLPPKRRAVGLRQVDGTALERSLRKDDQAKDLHVGDTAVLTSELHSIINTTEEPVTVRVKWVPGRVAERGLRAYFGMARDGLIRENGVPRDVLAGALLRHQGGLYMPPLPRWLHHGLMGSLGTVGRWAGKEKILSRYWPPDETT